MSRSVGALTSSSQEQPHRTKVCLVLLVGIPGCGKTYLRQLLERYFRNSKTTLGSVKVFSVSYDEFSKVKNPTQFNDCNWKEERSEICKVVENIVGNTRNFVAPNSNAVEKLYVVNSEINDPDVVLIIIDDNMYYRSMRYEYYKLSKTYNLSFCQIFLKARKEDALKYNKQRDSGSQVPDFVIERMFEKLEPPDNTWERNVLTVTPYEKFEENGILESILSLITDALSCPVQQNSQHSDKEASQIINNSNLIHQIDIALKQITGDLIKLKIKESNENPSAVSKFFSDQRLAILKEIKSGKVVLPIDFSETFSPQDIEQLKPMLSELFVLDV